MPVPTNLSPKSGSKNPSNAPELHSAMENSTPTESLTGQPISQKESLILVLVKPGETFTIQAGNDLRCIEGPAEVPMVSPNGIIPPIQVPQGYISQVIERHGLREVEVIPENQALPYMASTTLHSAPHIPVQRISVQSGVHYNYMHHGIATGSQQAAMYASSNHSSFQQHGVYIPPLVGNLQAQQRQYRMESDGGRGENAGERSPRKSLEDMQRHMLEHGQNTPHTAAAGSDSPSSASISSLSPTNTPDSPQKSATIGSLNFSKNPVLHGQMSAGDSQEYHTSPSRSASRPDKKQFDRKNPPSSNTNEATSFGNARVKQRGGLPGTDDPQRCVFATVPCDTGFHQTSVPRRPTMPEEKFELKTYLSSISIPEVCDVTSHAASIKWTMQYSLPAESNLKITFEVYLNNKARDGNTFKMIKKVDKEMAELNDLKPGSEYRAKVLAEANNARGAFSEIAVFRTLSCPPATPAVPKMTNNNKNSMLLKWNAPNDNGEKIFKYHLEWDEGEKGSGFRSLKSGREKQYKAEKLRPSQYYTFRLSCENACGVSPWSPEVTFRTAGAAPVTPESPSLEKQSVHSLLLRWGRPCESRPGSESYSSDTKFSLEMDDGKGYGFMAKYDGQSIQHLVSGLEKSSLYRFRLQAYNDNGKSGYSTTKTFYTLPDKPDPPGKVFLKGKAHSTYFKVAWDKPVDNGGSEVEEYVLEYCLEKGRQMKEIYRGKDTEFSVTNTIPGSTYRLRVYCVSKGGNSMPSDVAFVPVPPVIPGQCHPPWATSKAGSTIIHLQWGPPDYDGGSNITVYELGMCREEMQLDQVFHGNKLTHSVPNLKPGNVYKFAVRSGNKAGMGRWSELVELTTGPAPPETPESLQCDSVTSKNVQLSWKEPRDNGSEITRYIVEYGGQDSAMNTREPVTLSSCHIQHLLPNHLYFFRVMAENGAGKSPFCEVLSVKTAPSSPESVLKIWQDDITVGGDSTDEESDGEVVEYSYPSSTTSALIRWEEPGDNGSEITGYRIEVTAVKSSKERSTSSGNGTFIIDVGTDLSHLIEDLKPDSEYRVRIKAMNAVGTSSFSSSISVKTQPLPPDPPLLDCMSSYSSLKLKWNDADNNDYNLQMRDKHGRYVSIYCGAGKAYKVAKLDEKTQYFFQISAKNEAGEGPFSDPVSFVTTASPPSQLKTTPSVTVRNYEAFISWDDVGDIRGDNVSYLINFKTSEPAESHQIITDENNYSLPDLTPGVEYAVQVAVVRHSKTKISTQQNEKQLQVQDDSDAQEDDSANHGEQDQDIVDEILYEDITGPFTNWISFKAPLPEKSVTTSKTDPSDQSQRNFSGFFNQIWNSLNDESMKPALFMMCFFVLAFGFAYIVQFFVK